MLSVHLQMFRDSGKQANLVAEVLKCFLMFICEAAAAGQWLTCSPVLKCFHMFICEGVAAAQWLTYLPAG